MTYVFQEFPKWKYHDSGDAVMVDDKDAETALGEGWHDLPLPPQEVSRRDALLAAAADKGMKIDKRWSDERIQAALDAAPEVAPVAPVEGA
jgi:hypothetical protein